VFLEIVTLTATIKPMVSMLDAWRQPVAQQIFFSALIITYVMMRGLKKKSVSHSGAVAGWIVGMLTFLAGYAFGCTLLAFFFLGTKATVYQQDVKRKIEEEFKEGAFWFPNLMFRS
jgi:uncharacterized membrane protein